MALTAKKILSVFLAMTLVLFAPVAPEAEAKLTKVPAATVSNEQVSTANQEQAAEWFKVTTPKDYTVCVEGKVSLPTTRLCIRVTKHGSIGSSEVKYPITAFVAPNVSGEFSIKIGTKQGNETVPEVIDGKGTVTQVGESWATRPGHLAVPFISTGTYHLTIARAATAAEGNVAQGSSWSSGPLGGGKGHYAYKDVLLKASKANNLKVIGYPAAEANNSTVRNTLEKQSYHLDSYEGSYVRYTDPYLKDMAFFLRNPVTGAANAMTTAQVNYLKKVADSVAPASLLDYERLQRIYQYVAGNFYYDNHAYAVGKRQYSNPYWNIYRERNNLASANSAKSTGTRGKVGVVCQGYASMVVALSRSIGIPARLVRGCHISLPLTVWADKTAAQVGNNTHWWAEAYVDGRWVIIDANAGSWNTWTRSSFSAAGTWTKKGFGTYAGFDPSEQALALSYSYNSVYPGSADPVFMNRKDETAALKKFLNTKVSGKTNGKRLNANYAPDDFTTWGTSAAKDLQNNGNGRISRVDWNRRVLYGHLDLSTCRQLTFVNMYGTNLYSFSYWNGSKKVTFKRNNTNGFVGVTFDKGDAKKMTVYGKPKAGYKCIGIYNAATGKRVSAQSKYTFNPTAATYVVKFKKK